MSGGYVHIPPEPHICELPDRNGPESPPVGAIWLCTDCNTYWKFRHKDDFYGPAWDRMFWRTMITQIQAKIYRR